MDSIPLPQDFLPPTTELDDSDAETIQNLQETITEDYDNATATHIGKLAARDVIVMKRGFGSSFNSAATQHMIRQRRAQRDASRN